MYPFIAALFTIAKAEKQPKCPLMGGQRRYSIYIYTRNTSQPSEKSERKRQIPCAITYMWNLKYDTDEAVYETKADS